jgi:hypothetical protein
MQVGRPIFSVFVAAFLVGVAILGVLRVVPDPAQGAAYGVLFGVLSAVFWGMSATMNPDWSPALNIFAAIFAAATTGFLAPIETGCAGTVGVVSGEVRIVREPVNVLETLCSVGLMRQLQAQRR